MRIVIVLVCNGCLLFAFSFISEYFVFASYFTNRLFFRENSTHFKHTKMRIATVNDCVLLFLPNFCLLFLFFVLFRLGIEANENSTL